MALGELVTIPTTRQPRITVSVERCVAEIRGARIVVLRGGDGTAVALIACETATPAGVANLTALALDRPFVVISGRRAVALGLAAGGLKPVRLSMARDWDAAALRAVTTPLADDGLPADGDLAVAEMSPTGPEAAALVLAKIARLLPAVMMAPLDEDVSRNLEPWVHRHDLFLADAGDILQYDRMATQTLQQVADARVPLAGAETARIVAFRPRDGGAEHFAVIIGEVLADPTLVRLHSECFTGDLLGSLRCDCGEQLRGAIGEIGLHGSGVLLYLAQEGRGIGLVNKLRAYALQDRGFDTIEANEQLGFDADERIYSPAVQMLRALGVSRVRLLTNNPAKVDGLARLGIPVIERVPHAFPSNRHNDLYLRTKAIRAGHLF